MAHPAFMVTLLGSVPPAQVAEWAGNSVPVVLATYVRCISGRLSYLKKRIEAGGDLPEFPVAD